MSQSLISLTPLLVLIAPHLGYSHTHDPLPWQTVVLCLCLSIATVALLQSLPRLRTPPPSPKSKLLILSGSVQPLPAFSWTPISGWMVPVAVLSTVAAGIVVQSPGGPVASAPTLASVRLSLTDSITLDLGQLAVLCWAATVAALAAWVASGGGPGIASTFAKKGARGQGALRLYDAQASAPSHGQAPAILTLGDHLTRSVTERTAAAPAREATTAALLVAIVAAVPLATLASVGALLDPLTIGLILLSCTVSLWLTRLDQERRRLCLGGGAEYGLAAVVRRSTTSPFLAPPPVTGSPPDRALVATAQVRFGLFIIHIVAVALGNLALWPAHAVAASAQFYLTLEQQQTFHRSPR